ncbi:MAG: hypothetical protein AVDCRST_MAG29-777 [uncultured Nocardioidaceae bacterium]|uniref:PsbP C-terminal domain-containing protein n=1 Tax=uncultured Nocardioidaceae bacterium TaxID=253824 RepID=A0A6J4LA62_9ACTN|nr:MAG: hypothetical protein AVDCRST_MAG29-777 [uncultured Nocardioidaceae bacterium]
MRLLPRVPSDTRALGAAMAVVALLAAGGCGSTSEDTASDSASTSEAPTEDAPSEEESTTAEDGAVQGDGYTLSVPEGWTDLSEEAADVPELAMADLAYGDTSERGFASNLNTIVTPADGDTVDDPGVRAQLADQVEQALNVRPEPIADVEFDGEKGIGQTATVRRPDVILMQYVTVHEDKVYTLTVTLSAARAAESEELVAGVVDSWQWSDG